MKQLHTFEEVNEALRQFWPDQLTRPNVYTLDTIIPLMDYLGNPQEKLKIVHVAGTSGKTSTTYYVAALLKAAGKKVGLTARRTSTRLTSVYRSTQCRSLSASFVASWRSFWSWSKRAGSNPAISR